MYCEKKIHFEITNNSHTALLFGITLLEIRVFSGINDVRLRIFISFVFSKVSLKLSSFILVFDSFGFILRYDSLTSSKLVFSENDYCV